LAFALDANAIAWGCGAYNGAAAQEPDLQRFFPILVNASFIIVPLLGHWADTRGFGAPLLVMTVAAQGFLACIAFPSRVSLVFAAVFANVTLGTTYFLQGAYLLTFPPERFSQLLGGGMVVQALVSALFFFTPKEGSPMAIAWCVVLCGAYVIFGMHERRIQLNLCGQAPAGLPAGPPGPPAVQPAVSDPATK
jgi:hypothetical protein